MNINLKYNTIYALKFIIPIVIIISLFLGGISAGIITFEQPKKITGEITATIKIDFGDGMNYSTVITLGNSTVFDFLLAVEKKGEITIETKVSTMGSYVNSIRDRKSVV